MAFSRLIPGLVAPATSVRMRDASSLLSRLPGEYDTQSNSFYYSNRAFLRHPASQVCSGSVWAYTHDGLACRTLATLSPPFLQSYSVNRAFILKSIVAGAGGFLRVAWQHAVVYSDRRGCSSASSVTPEVQKSLPQDVGAKPAAKSFFANAYPETPLHFYRATRYSEASINHRMFYVNLIFLLFAWDVGSAMLDF